MKEIRQESSEMDPNWFKGLQRESWQLELLVSGFAIFLLAQAPKLIGMLLLRVRASDSVWIIYGATPILRLIGDAAILLGGCLVIHVAVRGSWIAMIGLESAFPKGVRHEKMGLSKWYRDRKKAHDGIALIRKLDDVASSIFAVSLLMVGTLVSVCILFCQVTLLGLAAEKFNGWLVYVFAVPALLLLAAIVLKLLNIMTGGFMSRHERLAPWFYPVDRLIVLLSLSFVYQPAYEILASNTSKWLVKGVVLLFIGVILVYEFRVHNIHTVGLNYHFYYDDQRPPGYLTPGFSIQSDIIEKDVLRVFIPADERHMEVARVDCPDLLNFEFQGIGFFGDDLGMGALILKWPERLKYVACVRSQYRLWLDDEEVTDVVFHLRSRPESGLMRHGFNVFVPLPREKSGMIHLGVERRGSSGDWRYLNRIPFWRTQK